jgi:integrase
MLDIDVTEQVYLAPPPRTMAETIPNADLRKAKKRIHTDRHWLLFHLLAYTGMRQGEIRFLQWDAVDLKAGSILLIRTKSGDPRYVPIHPTLGEVLADLRDEGYVITTRGTCPVAYDTWIADLREFAPGYTAHWFRRTFVSSLLDNGVDRPTVEQIIGHEEQAVMGRFYVKPNLQVMQRAVLKLYADDPV